MCKMCTRDSTNATKEETVPAKMAQNNHIIEKMKKKHNITTDPGDEEKQREVEYQPDLLAVSTQHTKFVFELISAVFSRMKDSKVYKIVTKFPQPVHITVGLLIILCWVTKAGDGGTKIWKALYVGAVAIHLGAQIWMTLVSGIVLYFNLPRHEFGRVQTVLFPVYYLFNSAVSLLALVSYSRIQYINKFQKTSAVQFSLLLVVFLIEASVRLYFVKPMLKAKHIKTHMELAAGGGQEVGHLLLGELAHCPRYMRILKAFRAYHSTIVMGTLITLGCSLYLTTFLIDSVCI